MTETRMWLMGSVAVYMTVMLLIGFWTSTKIRNTKDYIVAGSRMGWWLSIGTIFATWFGAETCMGSSRTAFEKGILGVIADPFGAGLCLILAGIFFARFFHKLGIETIVDFFEQRYGRKVAWGMSLLYIPVYLGWIGGQLLAFGFILKTLTGMPVMLSVVVSAAVVVVYTYAGGMWADAITDVVQMGAILIGFLVLFPVLIADLGGFAAIKAKIPAEFFYVTPHSSATFDWLRYVEAWMIVGIGSLPAQDLLQRMMSPRSASMARWASITAGSLYIVIGLIPVLLGIFGRVALPESNGDSILIDLSQKYLPLPLMALVVGALISAIMSTADSALLAPAGIIGRNILPYLKADASEDLKLKWCKWSIPIVAVLSLILALYFKNIYALCLNSWGILLVGVAAPMIAGVYWKMASTAAAIASAVAGTGSWILFTAFLPDGTPNNLFGFLVSCVVLVVVTLAAPRRAVPELRTAC